MGGAGIGRRNGRRTGGRSWARSLDTGPGHGVLLGVGYAADILKDCWTLDGGFSRNARQ